MRFNREIAGKARTAKDDISIRSMIRPVKSQEHQAVFLHQKRSFSGLYICSSMLLCSIYAVQLFPKRDKAKLGETWPRSIWETAKN